MCIRSSGVADQSAAAIICAVTRVVLIHWNADEGRERAERLRKAGFSIGFEPTTPASMKRAAERPPDAFVIDLSRLPSHGREVATRLRERKGTQNVPLVFVDGEKEKVDKVRRALPGAVFTSWSRVDDAVKRAIARPPKPPVGTSQRAGYSGTPLPQKLGIKPASTAGLIGAPDDFPKTLGVLPEGAKLVRAPRNPVDLIVWFTTSRQGLAGNLARIARLAGTGGLWIAWPKKTSGVPSDLTEDVLREVILPTGLVDVKVCAIDETWSGLKFTRRRR
jgi:CheY-like chemotaxis protein